MAHALPLYVARFSLSPAEGMELYASLQVHQLLDTSAEHAARQRTSKASSSAGLVTLTRGVHPYFLRDPLLMGCMYVIPTVEVPDMRGLQSLYTSTYGIDLASEYHAHMSTGDADTNFAAFMHQFIALLHVTACSIQLLACVQGKKVSKLVPTSVFCVCLFLRMCVDNFDSLTSVLPFKRAAGLKRICDSLRTQTCRLLCAALIHGFGCTPRVGLAWTNFCRLLSPPSS